jgi:hypothetical protein
MPALANPTEIPQLKFGFALHYWFAKSAVDDLQKTPEWDWCTATLPDWAPPCARRPPFNCLPGRAVGDWVGAKLAPFPPSRFLASRSINFSLLHQLTQVPLLHHQAISILSSFQNIASSIEVPHRKSFNRLSQDEGRRRTHTGLRRPCRCSAARCSSYLRCTFPIA